MASYQNRGKRYSTPVHRHGNQKSRRNSSQNVKMRRGKNPRMEELSSSEKPWKRSKKAIVLSVLCLVFSLIFLVGGVGFVYAGNLLGMYVYDGDSSYTVNDDGTPSKMSPVAQQETYDDPERVGDLYHDDAIFNVLLMGTDDYTGEACRTDSIILISIDRRHQKLKMTSFMRDMYLEIAEDNGYNRINTAYTFGGPKLLVKTIEKNFGCDIDKYVVVSFAAFEKIINTAGGVEIELTQDEADRINQKSGEENAWAVAGDNNLTGLQARYYARIRDGQTSDWGRTQRQRNVIESLIKKMKKLDILTITQMANEVVPTISSDLTQEEILAILSNAQTYLNYPTEQFRLPVDGFYESPWVLINGYEAAVLTPHIQWNNILVNNFIYEEDFPELALTLEHYGYDGKGNVISQASSSESGGE